MKNLICFILSLSLLTCKDKKTNNFSGIEIYMVKKDFPDFTTPEIPDCYYCLELKQNDLFNNALLTENEIESFDWENQKVILNEKGKKIVKDLKIPLQGMPVAMVLDGEIIYGFWFWNVFSSFGCDRVYTHPNFDFSIEFGLPDDNVFGEDPRYDKRLLNYLRNKK